MKTNTKIIVGLAAAGVIAFVVLRKKAASPSGNAFFTELNMVDCNCFSTEFFKDGTTKSTKVSIDRCVDDPDLRAKATQCRDAGPQIPLLESLGQKVEGAVSSLFGVPNDATRNPGQAV